MRRDTHRAGPRPGHRLGRWLLAAALCLPGAASADVGKRLALLEQEARQLGQNLPAPGAPTAQDNQRRLVDAEVAFALGDYDDAAIMLFDLASKPGVDQERALYYLGESLLARGDRGAARTYFGQVVAGNNTFGKHYQPAQIRLLEIAIALGQSADAEDAIAGLDRVSPSARLPEVTYAKGKWAFAQGKHDDALALFRDVAKGSPHELQALYFTGAAHVAKKDLAKAQEVYEDLVTRRPRSIADRRVIELSQLALGRVHYERDQLSRSIDAYLLVDRNSDLFTDALYEVAWVYVKSKQFDKALRALELLALSAPASEKTATLRILEGNLRIRKARMIRDAQLAGTLDAGPNDPSVEYDRAARVFAETHEAYHPSYLALDAMVKSPTEAAEYLAQLAGRSANVFQVVAPIPEAAAQYLREEPEVRLAVANQADLAAIQGHLAQTEQAIARLEAMITAGDKSTVYPQLAGRRVRAGQMLTELIALRAQLADQLVAGGAPAGEATARRRALVAQYTGAAIPEEAQAAARAAAYEELDERDASLEEVAAQLDSSQAIAVAVRTYLVTAPPDGALGIPAERKAQLKGDLAAIAAEAHAIEAELAELRRDAVLGRDLAGLGDEGVAKARQLRADVLAAQDAEHRALAGGNARLVALSERAGRVAVDLGRVERAVDETVERALAEAKVLLASERAKVVEYKAELATQERESREIGGALLAASFAGVKAKFYDIAIRTDVGSIDVLWSQKEDADADLSKLRLSRQRELRSLRDEFKDILDPAQLNAPVVPPPAAPAAPATPASPDQGGTGRVAPGGDARPATAPTVRPDGKAATPAPQPASAPKGGSR